MHAQAASTCRSNHQLNLRLLRFTASPHREEPVMLAQDLLAAKRPVDALQVVETAMEREPDDSDLMLTLGVALFRSGELEWARRVLVKGVLADEEWSEPWRWLGETLIAAGDRERGIQALVRAQTLGETDDGVSQILQRVSREDEVGGRISRFFANPELVDPALLLQELIEDERFDDAEKVLEVAFLEEDDDPDLLLLKGRIERARGNLAAARESFEQATTVDPEWAEAWSELEELYRQVGDEEGAREIMSRAHAAKEQAEAHAERITNDRMRAAKREAEARSAAERIDNDTLIAARRAAEKKRDDITQAARTARATEQRLARELEKKQRASAISAALIEAEATTREEARTVARERARMRVQAELEERIVFDKSAQEARMAQATRTARVAEAAEAAQAAETAKAVAQEETFARAFRQAELEARKRAAEAKVVKLEAEARTLTEREAARRRAALAAERADVEATIQLAREAAFKQAKVEAERRVAGSVEPSSADLEAAAKARTEAEAAATTRQRAVREAEARARVRAEKKRWEDAAVARAAEADALRQKARQAAAAQKRWEATAASREAAGKRALTLAIQFVDDARKRCVSINTDSSQDTVFELSKLKDATAEPVFELTQSVFTKGPAPEVGNVDAMLDHLLDEFLEDLGDLGDLAQVSNNDTLPGIPLAGASDGGVGMTQADQGLRVRTDGVTPYQPTSSSGFLAAQTQPGLKAPVGDEVAGA